MTRSDFSGSGSISMSGRTAGTTCHERPQLSFNQPQGPSSPPSPSLAQKWSILLRRAMHLERDGLVELEVRAAVQSDEGLTFEPNSTVITDPAGLP